MQANVLLSLRTAANIHAVAHTRCGLLFVPAFAYLHTYLLCASPLTRTTRQGIQCTHRIQPMRCGLGPPMVQAVFTVPAELPIIAPNTRWILWPSTSCWNTSRGSSCGTCVFHPTLGFSVCLSVCLSFSVLYNRHAYIHTYITSLRLYANE